MTKQKFLLQGILLTAFSLFLRVANIGYRSYLSAKIDAEGMGLYQLIFSVFMLAVTLSTSGISLAVTRMVTAAIAANRRETVRSVVTKCFLFCLTVSCTIAALLLVFSDFAAAAILGYKGAAGSLRILALGLPFMSLCTCMKGYFLAVDESLSTAMSDAVEQVLTILAAVALFWYFAPQSIEAACLAAMLASTFARPSRSSRGGSPTAAACAATRRKRSSRAAACCTACSTSRCPARSRAPRAACFRPAKTC